MESLGRILPTVLRQAGDSPEAREYAAFAAWSGAVGENVRRNCAPLALTGRHLRVATTDAMWKTQLDRLAPQLVFRINSALGAPIVTQIVFEISEAAVRAAHPGSATVPPGDVERARAELAAAAEAIPDAGLREAFLRAGGRCLARRGIEDGP